MVLFNIAMIAINMYYSLPLIKQHIGIKLSDVEEHVYQNYLQKYMNRRICKEILESGTLQHVAHNNYIVQKDNNYEGVYLIVSLRNEDQVNVYSNSEKIVAHYDKPFFWLGVIEYEMLRKAIIENPDASIDWPVSAKLEPNSTNSKHNMEINMKIFPRKALYSYFFKFETINKLYTGENGLFIKNALHSLWLESLNDHITDIDKDLSKFRQKVTEDNFDCYKGLRRSQFGSFNSKVSKNSNSSKKEGVLMKTIVGAENDDNLKDDSSMKEKLI